jgi:aspartate kinase
VPDKPGTASRIFTALSEANVIIDVIVQNVSVSGTTDISFTMSADELEKLGPVIDCVAKEIGAGEVIKKSGIAKLSVVGIGMRSHSGVAATLFECLGNGGVNIQMISTSEIKIAVIIDEDQIEHAAKLTHAAFGLAK